MPTITCSAALVFVVTGAEETVETQTTTALATSTADALERVSGTPDGISLVTTGAANVSECN